MTTSTPVERRRRLARRALLSYSFLLACNASHSFAQIVPPPRQDTKTATGVSFRSGSFSYQETDLSIGAGTNDLVFTRSYDSSTNMPFDLFTQGWAHSMLGFVSNQPLPQDTDSQHQLPPQRAPYVYHVSVGGKSVGFLGGSSYSATTSTGGPVGRYVPISPSGASLVFNGTDPSGYYTFTDSDGSVVNFTQGANGKISNWTYPDGTRLDFSYTATGNLQSVFSNRGVALLLSSDKACAVNLTKSFVTQTSSCPTEANAVTYSYVQGTYNTGQRLLSSATKNGATNTYSYVGADHLGCVKIGAQATCRIANTYDVCPPDPAHGYTQDSTLRFKDPVLTQVDGAGQNYTISYGFTPCKLFRGQAGFSDPDYRPFSPQTTSIVDGLNEKTTVEVTTGGMPDMITDPLSRTKQIVYYDSSAWPSEYVLPQTVTYPEGNYDTLSYDDRGNIVSKSSYPKPGSNLSPTTVSASFPASCGDVKTCNKPDYYIDAAGNRTDYTYDPANGQVLTESRPADSRGIRAVTRHAYVSRYAWVKNSAGGYSQASSPVWLLSEDRTCQNSATVGSSCAAGAADETVTTYDYGSDQGPNNLWLRGKTVAMNATSLRTCYRYDYSGNKIAETSPRAGLTSCPADDQLAS